MSITIPYSKLAAWIDCDSRMRVAREDYLTVTTQWPPLSEMSYSYRKSLQ
jgi:hypothetical protein